MLGDRPESTRCPQRRSWDKAHCPSTKFSVVWRKGAQGRFRCGHGHEFIDLRAGARDEAARLGIPLPKYIAQAEMLVGGIRARALEDERAAARHVS